MASTSFGPLKVRGREEVVEGLSTRVCAFQLQSEHQEIFLHKADVDEVVTPWCDVRLGFGGVRKPEEI